MSCTCVASHRYGYDCGSGIADQGGLSFTRDNAGNPVTWGDTAGLYRRVYGYEANSRLDSANYPGGSDVAGNGLVRMVTVTPAQSSPYTSAEYRYKVQTVDESLKMMPYPTVTRDERGYVSRNVLNDNGAVTEVWEDQGGTNLSLAKTKSTSYVESGDFAGQPVTKTVYDVGSSGEDQVTYYQYALEVDGGVLITTRETDSNGKVTYRSKYNSLDQLVWDQDTRGYLQNYRTDYAYDYQGRKTTTTYPAIDEKTMPPDPLTIVGSAAKTVTNNYACCHLQWTEDENGHKTQYDYDGDGRVVKTWTDISGQSADYPAVVYVYDDESFGVLQEVKTRSAQGTVRTTAYEYDARGKVKKIIYPYISQEGDLLGSEEFIYDDLGRLVLGNDGDGAKTAYQYDDHGRLSGVDYDYSGSFALPIQSFSADVTYDYEGHSRLVADVDGTINSVSVGGAYTYDPQRRIKTYTPDLPSGYGIIEYTWNNLGRKTSMTVPLGIGNSGKRIEYKYEGSGRQVGTAVEDVSATTGTALDTTTSTQTKFWYDNNQNRVKMTTKADGTYYFVYDPTASIPAVVYEQGPTYRHLNIREPDGSLVTRERYTNQGVMNQSRTYHFDGLGSTVALSDETGATTDKYRYDAWGNSTHTIVSGGTADNPYQFVGQLGYYTHYQEPDFQCLQLGVRYYDPATGRFAQRDPLRGEGEVTTYAYGRGNPGLLVDPRGLFPDFFDIPKIPWPHFPQFPRLPRLPEFPHDWWHDIWPRWPRWPERPEPQPQPRPRPQPPPPSGDPPDPWKGCMSDCRRMKRNGELPYHVRCDEWCHGAMDARAFCYGSARDMPCMPPGPPNYGPPGGGGGGSGGGGGPAWTGGCAGGRQACLDLPPALSLACEMYHDENCND